MSERFTEERCLTIVNDGQAQTKSHSCVDEAWRARIPIDIRWYLTSTRHLSTLEHGAYLLLMMHYWHNGCLPADDKSLASIVRMSARKWNAVKPTLAELFDANWTHNHLSEAANVAERNFNNFTKICVRNTTNRPTIDEWARLRLVVFRRDKYTCVYCGKQGGSLECDHVIPVIKGGASDESNLVCACKACNRAKGSRSVADWQQSLVGAARV